MSMDTLAALCDILECTPSDLIQPEVVSTQVRRTAAGDTGPASGAPRRTVIRRPGGP
jgi:hypothetical protein